MNDSSKVSLGLAEAERKTVFLCAGWALCSVLIFTVLAFLPSAVQDSGLMMSRTLLKIGAFAIATALCWRNAKEASIVSGQVVWQAIAVGLGFYALGDIVTLLWQLLWGLSSTAALSNVFHGISYVFLAIGLVNAILPRQTSLSLPQTLGIATIGILGIVLASWITFHAPKVSNQVSNPINTSPNSSVITADTPTPSHQAAPPLIKTIDNRLQPIAQNMGLLYIAGDCMLIVMAAALLVAFWGGTYSEAWKLISLAGLCLYVADMFMVYHQGQGSHTPGAFWEIFWILSALFFGLGASVEHGVSAQMKQKRTRQQWI
ncbi:MAG: hypothetical protein AB8B99_05335 [Phormidesmis sp.]